MTKKRQQATTANRDYPYEAADEIRQAFGPTPYERSEDEPLCEEATAHEEQWETGEGGNLSPHL
ncbi:hypothetical protein Stsp02_03960 [Streptomyces sp. NBRC 14336]|nr:hypothetical protein Stsp02_03960 [Streptomyces sp. NBRC 14336]